MTISPQLLDLLRCPLDPSNTRLDQVTSPDGEARLPRCRLSSRSARASPCMLPEEAQLPPGCASLDDLPCQQPVARTQGAGS